MRMQIGSGGGAGHKADLEPGAVAQLAAVADHHRRLAVGQRHQVPIPRNVIGHDLRRGRFGISLELRVGQQEHGSDTFRQGGAFLGVIKLGVLAQHQTIIPASVMTCGAQITPPPASSPPRIAMINP